MPATRAATGPRGRSLAVDLDRSLVRLKDAGEDLQQRRLAGAVLPEQGMHFAGLDRQRHALERANDAEPLGDARKMQARMIGHRSSSGFLEGEPGGSSRSLAC